MRRPWSSSASRLLATLAASCLSAEMAFASHTEFLFQLDRFEVAGNRPGLLVDEFDDGVLDPWLHGQFGTSVESGGLVTLSSPGTDDWLLTDLGIPIVLDRSDIFAPPAFNVFDGEGDFSSTSTWVPILPDPPAGFYGSMLGFQTPAPVGLNWNIYAAAIANLSEETAGYMGGADAGLTLLWEKVLFSLVDGVYHLTVMEVQTHPITPLDVTGRILFRISYDDTADTLTPSYSLDDGATFLTPFAPTTTDFANAPGGQWQIIADPPTTALATAAAQLKCLGAVHKGGAAVAKAQLSVASACMAAAASGATSKLGVPPQTQTAQVCLTNDIKGAIDGKAGKLQSLDAKLCAASPEQQPTVGYAAATATNAAAIAEGTGIVADLFGIDLDAAAVSATADPQGAACQTGLLKQASKIIGSLWKFTITTQKTLLSTPPLAGGANEGLLDSSFLPALAIELSDSSGKISKAIAGPAAETCFDASVQTPIASLLPGKCATTSNAAELQACLGTVAKCRWCRMRNALQGSDVDCDDLDDGEDDTSCD